MTLTCDTCGGEFTARAGARYCSGRCRTLAYRERREGLKPKRKRQPLGDAITDRTWALDKALRSLDALTQDDRFPKFIKGGGGTRVAGDLERCARTLDTIRARMEASQASRL